MIQYETSDILVGDTNIAEAIETDEDLLFSESYVVAGEKLKAGTIHANYNLVIIGDIEADSIEVNGELVVNGNIKARNVICLKLICTGKANINMLQCNEDVLAKLVTGDSIQVQGSILATDTIFIDNECSVERNIVAGEGISGSGSLHAGSTVVGDYFDFEGIIESNVYEIATMFETVHYENKDNNDKEFSERIEKLLSEFYDTVMPEEEDFILGAIYKCSKIQRVSFEELHYLFCEIDRISYLSEITNLRDYLLVKYTEIVLPNSIRDYETIEHVYSNMIVGVDYDELAYSADDLLQFAYSLKIVTTTFKYKEDIFAEKIFSSIGLKYNFVKKQFERV